MPHHPCRLELQGWVWNGLFVILLNTSTSSPRSSLGLSIPSHSPTANTTTLDEWEAQPWGQVITMERVGPAPGSMVGHSCPVKSWCPLHGTLCSQSSCWRPNCLELHSRHQPLSPSSSLGSLSPDPTLQLQPLLPQPPAHVVKETSSCLSNTHELLELWIKHDLFPPGASKLSGESHVEIINAEHWFQN